MDNEWMNVEDEWIMEEWWIDEGLMVYMNGGWWMKGRWRVNQLCMKDGWMMNQVWMDDGWKMNDE
jgi:hypothetical protein